MIIHGEVRHVRDTERNESGDLLWMPAEDATIRRLVNDRPALRQALPHRTRDAIQGRVQRLRLSRRNRMWTASERSKLRRLYPSSTPKMLEAAFPGRSIRNIRAAAARFGIPKAPKPLVPTGNVLVDQIRDRCRVLGYSMRELDEMVSAPGYFLTGQFWHRLDHRYLRRAVAALGGHLSAEWDPLE